MSLKQFLTIFTLLAILISMASCKMEKPVAGVLALAEVKEVSAKEMYMPCVI